MEVPEGDQILTMTTRREGTTAVIELEGELDLHESSRLTAEISHLLTEPVETVEIDTTALTFIDSAGVRAVLLARTDAADRGIDLRLSRVSPAVRRVLEIAGAAELLPKSD